MSKNKSQLGYLVSTLSVVVNIILFGFKLWVGLVTGSVALIADAWHTLSDSVSSLVVVVSIWVSNKPQDTEHPFGHGRADLIATIVIATLLGVISFEFTKESIINLLNSTKISFNTMAYIITSISILVKEIMAQVTIRVGKKINSYSLKADGWHHRSDAITSLIILMGISFNKQFWWIDGVLGLIVSLFILKLAYDLLQKASSEIFGKTADKNLVKKIKGVVKQIAPDVQDVHHVHLHSYGDHKEITFHLRLSPDINLGEAHQISNQIDERIRRDFNLEPTIHIEPIKK